MVFDFKNLGIVESANIELKGLTVITGLNDTGKSFLSKAIFSIIKTNKEASREARDAKFQQLQQRFRNLQQIESFGYTGLQQDKLNQLKLSTPSNILFTNILKGWNASLDISIDDIIKDLKNYKERINEIISENTHPLVIQNREIQIKNLNIHIENIINALNTRIEEPDKDYKDFYNMVIIPQLFKKQINSINNKDTSLLINVTQDGKPELNVKIKNNICEVFCGTVNEKFNDTIYIESPTSLQLLPFIQNALAFGGSLMIASQQRLAGLPYHLYDLVYKIANNANTNANIDFQNFINDVRAIIGGKMFYDQPSRTIMYSKEETNILDVNIASGIKGLGIIDILFSENILNKKTLLIIDEPEVHEHPAWEIKYAELIVKLSSIGIPILISSHSSYLIKAITKYVKQYNTQEITNFYFGKKVSDSKNSTFENVTNDLKPIFKALAEPMADII